MLLRRRALAVIVAVLLAAAITGAQELPAADGWAALERGDGSMAAAIFREALDRSPSNPLLHYGSARASLILGRTDAAISSLKKAVEHNPKFAQAYALLARVAYDAADLDLAVRSLEKAVALVPGNREMAAQLTAWKQESDLHRGFQASPGLRFNVLFEGPAQRAIGDRVSSVLDRAYWTIGKQLDIYPGAPLDVILYSNQQFQAVTRAPAWAAGGYDGRIRLPVGGALRSPQELDRVVIHEYVHSVVRSAAPRGVPAWIDEGLASYLEPGAKAWVARVLKDSRERIPLEVLNDSFTDFDDRTSSIAYAQSHVAAELLVERVQPYVGAFLQLLGNGHTVDQALSRHGVQPDAFYAEWRRRVGLPAAR